MTYLFLSCVLLLALSCVPASDVVGFLCIAPGVPGDVRQCLVQLFEADGDTAVYGQRPLAGTKRDRVRFRFHDVRPGEYHLVAWQDMNGDSIINDGDLVGVYQGEYQPRQRGGRFKVEKGLTSDLGEIWLTQLREPVKSVTGLRDSSRTKTHFSFVFYHDLTLGSLTVTFPGYGSYIDPLACGPKQAGQTYHSRDWEFGGAEMPTGEHRLTFAGIMDGRFFEAEFVVTIE